MSAFSFTGALPAFGEPDLPNPPRRLRAVRPGESVAPEPLGAVGAPGPGIVEALVEGIRGVAGRRSRERLEETEGVRGGAGAGSTIGRRASAHGAETDMPLADRSDEALMTAYMAGDRTAFVELVERYRTELHGFLARFLGSAAAADDVFQDTFLQVHLAAHTFDQERQFKPWLFTIAANKARDWHRRQKRRAAASLDAPLGADAEAGRLVDLLEAETASPAAPTEAGELREQVKRAVDGLPPHYREILLLNYFQRMSYNQIAEVLGIPLGTVKSRLHAAVGAFAQRWHASNTPRRGSGESKP